MLTKFGHYLLKSRLNAGMWALFFGFMPLLGWVSSVIVGFVTLRQGPREGLWVLFWASVPEVVAAILGYPEALIFGFLAGGVYIWCMAIVLRNTVSWTYVLEATVLIALTGVLVTHLVVPDVVNWWAGQYHELLNDTEQGLSTLAKLTGLTDPEDLQNFVQVMQQGNLIKYISMMTTGLVSAFILLANVINLVLARWWQAILFNPKGLRQELYGIRLGYLAIIGFLITVGLIFSGVNLAWDLMPVFVAVFLVAGLSLLHYIAAQITGGIIFLGVFYLLTIILPPYFLAFIVITAVIDSLLNIRNRLGFLN